MSLGKGNFVKLANTGMYLFFKKKNTFNSSVLYYPKYTAEKLAAGLSAKRIKFSKIIGLPIKNYK